MKRFFVCLGFTIVIAALILACGTPAAGRLNMTPGTFTASAASYMGPLTVEVRTSANAITNIRVDAMDTPGLSDWAIDLIPRQIIEHQSLAVDIVTGVTITSMAIINAVEDALRQAGADMTALYRPISRPRVRNQTLTADVIIVGGGGAGLSAAVAATDAGASVIVIEKAGFIGGNSIVSGGIYNAPNTVQQQGLAMSPGLDRLVQEAIDEAPVSEEHRIMQNRVRAEFEAHRNANRTYVFDSPAWFALQTWNGGDRLGILSMVYTMTSNALAGVRWLENMGMEFLPNVGQGGGSLYPRTLFAVRPLGVGYFEAFSRALEGRRNYTQLMETRATGLIIERGRVVGVNAVNNHTGQRITLRANNGVILATGGFAANVELRQHYSTGFWSYLGPTLLTTNVATVTGDGHFFARDAGAHLINMEHIQLLQTVNPVTGALGDNAFPFGIMGYLFINKEGNRFVREDGRRDEVCKAIMAQPGGIAFLLQSSESIPDPNTVLTLDNRTVAFMLENNLSGWVTADTLEEMAAILGVPYDNLSRTVAAYNAAVDAGLSSDEFGRAMLSRRIATGPWFAYPRRPAAHYTMGGVLVDEYGRTLREDRSVIPGLFAAGEITGVLHGTNRLGGNAIVDFVVFGRIAGASAAAGR